MARNNDEINRMLIAYETASEHLFKIDENTLSDVLAEESLDDVDIDLNRWIYLVTQSLKVQNDEHGDPEFHKIPGVTDDEINALFSAQSLDRIRERAGKTERYSIAAALFNAQLERDHKEGKRLTRKPFTSGDSFGRCLRRYLPKL
jgi:hypothetical protein